VREVKAKCIIEWTQHLLAAEWKLLFCKQQHNIKEKVTTRWAAGSYVWQVLVLEIGSVDLGDNTLHDMLMVVVPRGGSP
jgi:hypothetical protein